MVHCKRRASTFFLTGFAAQETHTFTLPASSAELFPSQNFSSPTVEGKLTDSEGLAPVTGE